jgi:hypothetical protein
LAGQSYVRTVWTMHASRPGAFTDTDIEKVEADFPGWRVWRSRDHRGEPASWYASRRHAAEWVEPQSVAGDTEAELRAELASAAAQAVPAL